MKRSWWLLAITAGATLVYAALIIKVALDGDTLLPPAVNFLVGILLIVGMAVLANDILRDRALERSLEQHRGQVVDVIRSVAEGFIGYVDRRVGALADDLGSGARGQQVALATDVARVESAIDELARDRDLQVARIYDAIGEASLTADRELRTQMTWVIERFNGGAVTP